MGALRAGGSRQFPRALADRLSARKVISLITGVIRSQLITDLLITQSYPAGVGLPQRPDLLALPPVRDGACHPGNPNPETALEATQGQMDGFFSQFPYQCYLEEVASVGD